MNDSWHSYPSIYAVGHKAVSDLIGSVCNIEEKVDGSQFSFGVFGGEIRVRSKGKQMEVDAPEKMFALAVDYVKSSVSFLKDGWTYRGEFLAKPKHNTLAYSRVPKNNIIIFDINTGHEEYLSYDEKASEAERIGLECVPLLGSARLETFEQLKTFLETDSVLGGQKVEGVVLKPIQYDVFGKDKKVLLAKYVSEAFKEIHNKEWKASNPNGLDIIAIIGESLRTDARWEKAVQHLKDNGVIEGSPRDIGKLIKEVQQDIDKECREYVAGELLKWAMPKVTRLALRGLPEWYKEKIATEQIEAVS
jgi:hypothetical protein